MEEKEQKELLEKVNSEAINAVTKFKDEFKDIAIKAAEGKMTKGEVDVELDKLEKNAKDFTNLQLKELSDELGKVKKSMQDQGSKLKALGENPKSKVNEKFGFGTIFRKSLERDGLIDEVVIDQITGKKTTIIKGWERNDIKIQTKTAIDMTTALTQLPGSTPGTSIGALTDYAMQEVQININKDQHVNVIFPTDPISGEYMGVMVDYSYVDGADVTVEGAAPGQSSLKLKSIEYKVLDYSALIRVHKNMLKDVPRLESKLNRIVPDSILGALDDAVFSTTGDNSATAWGLYYAGNYVAFSYDASLGDKVANATIINLIGKMVLQAELLNQDVNSVVLNPALLNGLRHEKDALGNSLSDRNIVFNSMGQVVSIWGLNVKLTKKQNVNYATVLWDQAAEIGILEDIQFEIGTDADDFSKRFRTILYVMRAAFGVSKPGAIIFSDDVATDLDSITAV